jgi:hypothetical protein
LTTQFAGTQGRKERKKERKELIFYFVFV